MRKRVTVISGHYGSGKTELSVNLAISKRVDMLIDLDIVNPYFRSRETEQLLNEVGVEVVSSPLGNSPGSDLPYLSARIHGPFHNQKLSAIIDLGGDDVGAKVFRQFGDFDVSFVDHLLVINVFRERTSDKEGIVKVIREIEESSGLKIKGLINNTNLLKNTTIQDIIYGQNIIKEVSKELNLDIVYTSILEGLEYDSNKIEGEIINLKLYLRKDWL